MEGRKGDRLPIWKAEASSRFAEWDLKIARM